MNKRMKRASFTTAAAAALTAMLSVGAMAAGPGGFISAGDPPPATTDASDWARITAAQSQTSDASSSRRVQPGETVLARPTAVPMELTSGLPFVQAQIDGQGPYRFILDTGASSLTISAELADRLSLPEVRGTKITSVSPVASYDLGHPRQVRELRIGEGRFRNIDAAAADLTSLKMGPVDGIIGMAVFAGCRLTLDYPAQRIVLEPLGVPTAPAKPGEVLPARPVGAYVFTVPVKVQDKTLWCLLDSGSNGRLSIPEVEAQALPVTATATNETASHMFGGEKASSKLARLSCSVYLGRWELASPIVDVMEHDQLILGGGILENFAVTIDCQAKTVRLTRAAEGPIPSPPPLKTLGVAVRREGKVWVVTGAHSGVDLDALGLKVSDKILRIERQAVAQLTQARLEEMMRAKDALQMDLDRNGRRFSHRVPLTVLIP